MDTKTVFLHGKSDLALYIEQPVGFVDQRNPSKVEGHYTVWNKHRESGIYYFLRIFKSSVSIRSRQIKASI